MGEEALLSKPPSLWARLNRKENLEVFFISLLLLFIFSSFIFLFIYLSTHPYEPSHEEYNVPDITMPSMDFTVLNITETHLTVKWDLLIRIPPDLPGFYICLEGDFQVFIIYKGVTISTSSVERFNLKPWWAMLLKVSSIASEGDMEGVIVKDIMETIKERGEIRFGSRLHFPDCRYGTTGESEYACGEARLRFKPGSHRMATLFGNHSTCPLVV